MALRNQFGTATHQISSTAFSSPQRRRVSKGAFSCRAAPSSSSDRYPFITAPDLTARLPAGQIDCRSNTSSRSRSADSVPPSTASTFAPYAEQELHAATSSSSSLPQRPLYTSMRADPPGFWDSHKGLRKAEEDDEELFLVAELRLLANAAGDRAEMHAILAQQRDNWNEIFQRTLTAATMTACVLGGLDGQAHSLSLSLPALLLNAGCAAMMAVINQFQPSQLAEEQRTAARLFRKLANDVNYALQVAPHLRQHTPSLLRDSRRRLEALDKAYPMPLTPGGLEKFPAKVVPPVLIAPEDHYTESSIFIKDQTMSNGWDGRATSDLEEVAALLRRSDIKTYTSWAQNLVNVNKCLAVAAPMFAASAAVLNGLSSTGLLMSNLGVLAAVCSMLAAFAGSFSHDMQLGMVFELYRNSAGYYADIEASIQETLRAPLEQRENGVLFRQRVAYQLGRSTTAVSEDKVCSLFVPADSKAAGTLF